MAAGKLGTRWQGRWGEGVASCSCVLLHLPQKIPAMALHPQPRSPPLPLPPCIQKPPHLPGRDRSDPAQQSILFHRVPSRPRIPSRHGEPRPGGEVLPAAGGVGASPRDEAALGSHVFFPWEARSCAVRLQMSISPATRGTAHCPGHHFIPPGAAPTCVCRFVTAPCLTKCVPPWCVPIAGRAGVGEGRQGRAAELGEPSACCLRWSPAQPVMASSAHSPCLRWTGRCCWRMTEPLLALFALRRVQLLSLAQKCQQAEGKCQLMGWIRGGEWVEVPADPRQKNPGAAGLPWIKEQAASGSSFKEKDLTVVDLHGTSEEPEIMQWTPIKPC